MLKTEDTRKSNGTQTASQAQNRPIGLKASLSQDREATLSWVEEAPLRLIAAALVDTNRKGRTAALRESLTPEIIPTRDWDGWWRRVQNAIKESSREFDYTANGGNIHLKVRRPSDIEAVSLSELPLPAKKATASKPRVDPSTRQADWFLWILGDGPDTAPADKPPPALVPFLHGLNSAHIDVAIKRLVNEIERRLVSSRKTLGQSTRRNWLAPLTVALKRWSGLNETVVDIPLPTLSKIAAIASSNSDLSGQNEHDGIVEWLVEYASRGDRNVGLVSDALQLAAQETESGIDDLLRGMCGLLGFETRVDLWRRLIRSRLADKPLVQRWLGLLSPEDKSRALSALVGMERDEDSIRQIGDMLISEWGSANPEQRHYLFEAVAIIWILHGRLLPGAKAALLEAEWVPKYGDQGFFEQSPISEWMGIIQDAAQSKIESVREDKDRQIGDLHSRLDETEVELKRAKEYEGFLQAENRKARRGAELEITRKAITVLGIALQRIAVSSVPKPQEISDVESGITLALSTLGAGPVGDIGTTVPFDPSLHEAHPPPAIGTPVKITAPGLAYSRRMDAPLNLVKIQVKVEE